MTDRPELTDEEIQVTPEMVEAGVEAYFDPEVDELWDARRHECVTAIYRKMERARRSGVKKGR